MTRSSLAGETETGEEFEADVLIVATGQLNQPAVPDLPGRERFAGHSFHSARWDHDYDLRRQARRRWSAPAPAPSSSCPRSRRGRAADRLSADRQLDAPAREPRLPARLPAR